LDLNIVEAVTHQGRDTKAAIDLVKPDAVYSDKLPCWWIFALGRFRERSVYQGGYAQDSNSRRDG